MTDPIASGNCRKLAHKMVYSYSEEKAEVLKAGVITRYRQSVRRRNIGIGMMLGVLLLFGGAITLHLRVSDSSSETTPAKPAVIADTKPPTPALPGPIPVDPNKIQNADSKNRNTSPRAIPSPGTRFTLEEEETRSIYSITRGRVRFEIGPDVTQQLLVRVGNITIEDIGTIFTVETVADNQVRVAVAEGRVKITWPDGHAELKEGSRGTFPRIRESLPKKSSGRSQEEMTLPKPTATDWRDAARAGNNELALQIIDKDGDVVRNRLQELLLAADVMRFTGHPDRAVSYLTRAVKQFPKDKKRATAAFTLGKVLMDTLHRPRDAAKMFSLAAQNQSPLTEEAMARETEAWYDAGEHERAKDRAEAYLKRFPQGARAKLVRSLYHATP